MSALGDVLTELGLAHDYQGAPCVGRWSLFDPAATYEPAAEVAARYEAGRRLCGAGARPGAHGEAGCGMTVHRKPRVLLQQCTAPGCPFLTRSNDWLCPLHAWVSAS